MGASRPGQGPAGSQQTLLLVMDAATCKDSGIPPRATPPGFLGNLVMPVIASVSSSGGNHGPGELDQHDNLLQALAQTCAQIRASILANRAPGAALQVSN